MEQIEAVKPELLEFDADHKAVALPEGWALHDVAKMLPPPERIRQKVELLTLEAFTGYVGKFKTLHSTIFADESTAQYEAVIDYHDATQGESPRGDCDHIAKYTCPQSDQWKLWTKSSGTNFTQVDFARFIEDNIPDIVQPKAADFLQLVLQLQIHKSANFVSDIRLADGQTRLRYEETVRNDTKQGDLQFPDAFVLNIPVFVDGKAYALKARLRYRLDESKLRVWYELERPADVFRAAVKEVSQTIRSGLTDVAFWAGKRT